MDSVPNFVNLNLVHILLSINSFRARFNRVVKALDNRIGFLFFLVVGACFHWVKPVLNKPSVCRHSGSPCNIYVIVPADKVA